MKRHESMACPKCGKTSSKVTNKRNYMTDIYRRRQCLKCGSRFTTEEKIKP